MSLAFAAGILACFAAAAAAHRGGLSAMGPAFAPVRSAAASYCE